MITRVGVSPKLYSIFGCFSPATDPHMMLCTIVTRKEFRDTWWDAHAPRLRPVVVEDVHGGYQALLELSSMYPNAKNAPTRVDLETRYDEYIKENCAPSERRGGINSIR